MGIVGTHGFSRTISIPFISMFKVFFFFFFLLSLLLCSYSAP